MLLRREQLPPACYTFVDPDSVYLQVVFFREADRFLRQDPFGLVSQSMSDHLFDRKLRHRVFQFEPADEESQLSPFNCIFAFSTRCVLDILAVKG